MNNYADKCRDINSILKNLYVSYFGAGYNADMVYQYLIFRNVDPSERGVLLTNLYSDNKKVSIDFFLKWMRDFKDDHKVRVYCERNFPFCKFESGHINPLTCYKLYVPISYDYLDDSVKKIINFMNSHFIRYSSKVSRNIRFDDFVIRLKNERDCKKVLDFINSDDYIKSGMIHGNSFAFSFNGVNLSYDGYSSYNYFLSSLIALYINNVHNDRSKDVSDVSISTFDGFLKRLIRDKDFSLLSSIANCPFYDEDEAYLMISLLRLNLHSNDINDYFKFMNIMLDDKKRDNIVNSGSFDITSIIGLSSKDIFEKVILYCMNRYGINGYSYVEKFLINQFDVLSENSELYNLVINSGVSGNDCFSIASRDSYISVKDDDFDNRRKIIYNYVKQVMFEYIIRCVCVKYNISNVDGYINFGNKAYITKDGNARWLTNVFNDEDMRTFLNSVGVKDVYEYEKKYLSGNKKVR